MSQIALSPPAGGTGVFTIAAPATNTNQTLTLPDATGTLQVSGTAVAGTTGSFTGDLSFNSGYGSAAVAYGCRAWVNFNGTGTVAIRASGNVSSITRNGVGDYTVNFTTAMPDANYSVGSMGASAADPYRNVSFSGAVAPTTSALRIVTYNVTVYGPEDAAYTAVAIFR